MNWELPPPAETWKAIELYLARAYAGDPPLGVRARLDALRSASESDFYRLAAFERFPSDEPVRFLLRLGNRFYPHMKLAIERSPDGVHCLFGVDTHDRHVQPKPHSAEAAAFAELARKNLDIARQIEQALDENGLPTFKRFLRDDLARRTSPESADTAANSQTSPKLE
jgi:hypothetical protein